MPKHVFAQATEQAGNEAEQATEQATEQAGSEATHDAGEFQAITSQDQLDKLIAKRVARERAKYADYDDLKAIAQKAGESNAQLKAEVEALKKAADRREWVEQVAGETGIPAGVLRGETLEEIQAHAKALGEAFASVKPVLKGQAKQADVSSTPEQLLVRSLFK